MLYVACFMIMSLTLHLFIHLFFSLLAGFIVWLFFRRNLSWALGGAILGGFLVDFDHFLDYYLAFGWNFNFYWFAKGYEFLKLDQIHLFFHGWEYVIIILIIGLYLKKPKIKIFLFAVALGLFFHLSGDVVMNEGLMLKSYSLIYKIQSGFQVEKLVTPEHYLNHQARKKLIKFE